MKMSIHTIILISLLFLCSNRGYSQTTQYSDFLPSVFEGSTVVEDVYSPALEGNLQGNPSTQPVKVYLPPGYDNFTNNKYPVVYLLHGGREDYNSFYYEYDLLNKLNRLISERIMGPMIIVTPNASTDYGDSKYTNSYVSGNWEDYIIQDVIQSIESNYLILDQREYRGLAGYSMGAYGTAKIAMKHTSLFNSICMISGATLDFEDLFLRFFKSSIIAAATINEYRSSNPPGVRSCFGWAVSLAPDSTSKPVMGRLPIDVDSVLIDSIWQKWLLHDPITMLSTYRDSMLMLDAIQMYIGDKDEGLPASESFHQSLLDQGIEHGNEVYSGEHNPEPVLEEVLRFFSEQLRGVVPMVRSLSNYYLENKDALVAETDMDGELYVVQVSVGIALDSIYKYHLATIEATANEENAILLSELEYGKYQLYAINSDTVVCNIPAEFCIVPDTSPPILSPENSNVIQGDSIQVSMSREGKICLVAPNIWFPDTLRTASDIMNSPGLVKSVDTPADSEISFSTDDLSPRTYWLYGFDQYGIVQGPIAVGVVPVGIPDYNIPEIMLYPNPVTGKVTLHTNKHDVYDLSISSLNGQLNYRTTMEGTSHQLDLSSSQKGVYFITIRSKDFVTTKKIIKL